MNFIRLRVAFLALMLGLLVACSQQDSLSEEQVGALEDRVHARWESLIARDFKRAWSFGTPAFKQAFPQKLYPLKFSYSLDWELTSIEVVNYDAPAAVASVVVRVMSKPTKQTSAASRAVGAVPVTFREQWILIDGEWWYSANA
ncbi:hypothetical protein N9878_02370 [bacterium]|nr:hypothetical protein [bacterium]